MTMRTWIGLLCVGVAVAGCGEGEGKAEADPTVGDEDSGGTGDEEEDSSSDGDDSDDEDDVSVATWVSDWTGEVEIWSLDDAYGWTNCEGTLSLDVDPDGEVDGRGLCEAEGDGWGEDGSYELTFTGRMYDDGELDGELLVEAGSWGDVVLEVDAQAEVADDEIEGDAEGDTEIEYWGETYTLELEAEFSLQRD